jgi:hypothetical protein
MAKKQFCFEIAAGALILCKKEKDMSEERITAQEPASFADLPIQPTGSGVQDLEIAYEQMALAQDASNPSGEPLDDRMTDSAPNGETSMPIEDEEAAVISAAHPS